MRPQYVVGEKRGAVGNLVWKLGCGWRRGFKEKEGWGGVSAGSGWERFRMGDGVVT